MAGCSSGSALVIQTRPRPRGLATFGAIAM